MTPTASLSAVQLQDLVDNRRFGVEYQPIVDPSGRLYAYEALARFYAADGAALSPPAVFDALHRSPRRFFEVEYAIKRLQLAQAPAGARLFVNLDPHAVAAWGSLDDDNPLLRLLCRPGLCIEIIENTDITDAQVSQALAQFFHGREVMLALDDLGAPHSLLSLSVLVAVDVVKFDRSWLKRLDQPCYQTLFRVLVDYVRRAGKRAVLEGIETAADLLTARTYGIELVQGFYFRDRFVAYREAGWERRGMA